MMFQVQILYNADSDSMMIMTGD